MVWFVSFKPISPRYIRYQPVCILCVCAGGGGGGGGGRTICKDYFPPYSQVQISYLFQIFRDWLFFPKFTETLMWGSMASKKSGAQIYKFASRRRNHKMAHAQF